MRPLVTRELIVIARTPAFWIAGVAYVCALVVFVVVWGDGVPIHGGRPPFAQFLSVQIALLALVLPWTGIRCVAPPGAPGLAILAVAAASPLSRVVLARCLGVTLASALIALAGLPLIVVVQQVAAQRVAASALALVPLLGLAALSGVAATGSTLAVNSRIGAWLAATGITVAVALTFGLV